MRCERCGHIKSLHSDNGCKVTATDKHRVGAYPYNQYVCNCPGYKGKIYTKPIPVKPKEGYKILLLHRKESSEGTCICGTPLEMVGGKWVCKNQMLKKEPNKQIIKVSK